MACDEQQWAERWAARAPELRWEALWAVWWAARDPDDAAPWKTPRAAAWHAQQFFGSDPSVIELEIPAAHVSGGHGEALSPEGVQEEVQLGVPELTIRPPGEPDWIKSVRRTRRPVAFTAVAGLLRVSTDNLADLVNDGHVPEPRPGRLGTDATWFEDELPLSCRRNCLRPSPDVNLPGNALACPAVSTGRR